MAYMVDDKGPYPNKSGEFCGNYQPNAHHSWPTPVGNETPQQAARHEKEYLARMRFGRPRPCKAKYVTAKNGWVGLYLKEDRPLLSWETQCETPPELLEPAS